MNRVALVVGATGLVGSALIRLLLEKDYYQKIIVLSRRELEIKDNRIKLVLLPDFDKMSEVAAKLNAHDVYCALGTTIRQAGSKENFVKIDAEWPLALANIMKNQSLFEQFLMVTAVGANPNSPLFYNKVKGEVEQALEKTDLKALKLFQPSLLLGNRDEFRFLEELYKFFNSIFGFFMIGSKTMLWSIRAEEVAAAMFQVARRREPGLERFKPRKMIQLAS